ncbi:MAG: hotdog fold thioesterase [Propionibacteriaceae bacterium]|nr:hotdog fold thioesterase [Propionibacteriaceae bacterium]
MELSEWRSVADTGLHTRMGIEMLEVGPELTRGRMPVEGNTQPYGLLHGGASCVLAESLASLAAVAAAGQGGAAFGIEINATHHEAARTGWVHGEARALRIGGTLGTWEVIITDDGGRRTCTARVTCAIRRAKG